MQLILTCSHLKYTTEATLLTVMRGIAQWVDGHDADEVSILELFELVKHLGYDEQSIQYHYKHNINGSVEIKIDNNYFRVVKLVK